MTHPPQRGPAANVVPTELGADHGGSIRVLHDRLVEGNRGRAFELRGAETYEVKIRLCTVHRGEDARGDVRGQPRQLVEEKPRREQEHPAVPAPAALAEQATGDLDARLLDELSHACGPRMVGMGV